LTDTSLYIYMNILPACYQVFYALLLYFKFGRQLSVLQGRCHSTLYLNI